MDIEKKLQEVIALAPERAHVSLSIEVCRPRAGEVATEWVLYVTDAFGSTMHVADTYELVLEKYKEELRNA